MKDLPRPSNLIFLNGKGSPYTCNNLIMHTWAISCASVHPGAHTPCSYLLHAFHFPCGQFLILHIPIIIARKLINLIATLDTYNVMYHDQELTKVMVYY